MAIPEATLETWSHQGATGPSRDTYASVKNVLEDKAAPFANENPQIFLQGSYANDTNTARDSDVDVVAFITGTFAHDANTLAADQYLAFERAYPNSATYSYDQYKQDVARWLTQQYGNGVRPGRKAIYIPARQNRRECDVLPAIEYRYYYRFNSTSDQSYAQGICFYLPDGTKIVNFPKHHSDNCTTKHQDTHSWFKRIVRLYKNMRNYMVDQHVLQEGVAPSYFIEGMLYNVPNDKFATNFENAFVETFNYIAGADRSSFHCANGIQLLFGNSEVTWPAANCERYLDALRQLWNNF